MGCPDIYEDDCRVPEVATQFGIMSIPTLIILKNGEVAKKFVGIASKDDIAAAIDAAM